MESTRLDIQECVHRLVHKTGCCGPTLPGEVAAELEALGYEKYNPKRARFGRTYDAGWVPLEADTLVQDLLRARYAADPTLLPAQDDRLYFFADGDGWHWVVTYGYLMMLTSAEGSRAQGIWPTSEVRRTVCFFLASHQDVCGLDGEGYEREVSALSDFGVHCDDQGRIVPEDVEAAQHFLATRECSLRYAFEQGEDALLYLVSQQLLPLEERLVSELGSDLSPLRVLAHLEEKYLPRIASFRAEGSSLPLERQVQRHLRAEREEYASGLGWTDLDLAPPEDPVV